MERIEHMHMVVPRGLTGGSFVLAQSPAQMADIRASVGDDHEIFGIMHPAWTVIHNQLHFSMSVGPEEEEAQSWMSRIGNIGSIIPTTWRGATRTPDHFSGSIIALL